MRTTLEPSLDPAAYPFVTHVRVRFAETDAMGVAHHGSYLPWLEEARVAYLRHTGHPYTAVRADGFDIAVVECHVRYRASALFHAGLAVVILLFAGLTGGDLTRAVAFAALYFVAATGWTWFRFRQRASRAKDVQRVESKRRNGNS